MFLSQPVYTFVNSTEFILSCIRPSPVLQLIYKYDRLCLPVCFVRLRRVSYSISGKFTIYLVTIALSNLREEKKKISVALSPIQPSQSLYLLYLKKNQVTVLTWFSSKSNILKNFLKIAKQEMSYSWRSSSEKQLRVFLPKCCLLALAVQLSHQLKTV